MAGGGEQQRKEGRRLKTHIFISFSELRSFHFYDVLIADIGGGGEHCVALFKGGDGENHWKGWCYKVAFLFTFLFTNLPILLLVF